jgi:hypothetical protein
LPAAKFKRGAALSSPLLDEAPALNIQPEVITMFIREGASTIAAAVVRKTAIQFVRLVSLYHAIAGMSDCCADQPLVLVFTAILSAVKLALSVRQRRNRFHSEDEPSSRGDAA